MLSAMGVLMYVVRSKAWYFKRGRARRDVTISLLSSQHPHGQSGYAETKLRWCGERLDQEARRQAMRYIQLKTDSWMQRAKVPLGLCATSAKGIQDYHTRRSSKTVRMWSLIIPYSQHPFLIPIPGANVHPPYRFSISVYFLFSRPS